MDSERDLERAVERSSAFKASDAAFLMVENGVYILLGAILALTAGIALVGAIQVLIAAARDWSGADQLVELTDRLLLVLMLVEILHTVRVSLRSGQLSPEPFLIVGLIASIRRVLVITLRSSELTHDTVTADSEAVFRWAMTELGILSGLILVMVISLYLLRRGKTEAHRAGA